MGEEKVFRISGQRLVRYQGAEAVVTVPEGIVQIGDRAFLGCNSLRQVRLPASVRTIGRNAFQACRNLEAVQLPEQLESIGGAAFDGCGRLEMLALPPNIRELPMFFCNNCTGLKRVRFPQRLERIEWRAFYGCESLEELTLPQSLEQIGHEAFAKCRSLKALSLPDGIRMIDGAAFAHCERLRVCHLPERLSSLEKSVFSGCDLREIRIPEGVERVDFTAFSQCPELEMIRICGENVRITHYGNGDPARMPADVPLFFEKPKNLAPGLRRNMLRGYARQRLAGHTTPEQDGFYRKYIRENLDGVCYWGIRDRELWQLLLQDRLIPVEHVQALLQELLRQEKNELVTELVDYMEQLRQAGQGFDPTVAFRLDEG